MKIACVGEAMIELSVGSDNATAEMGFAGDTLNTAVYLQRCLEAADAQGQHSVSYITAVGQDSFSEKMLSLIARENINTDLIGRSENHVPGLYAINTDANGERSFTYWREQSAARTLFSPNTHPELHELSEFNLIYYSAISLGSLSMKTSSI